MSLAPIALFVYKRLVHTKQAITALRQNALAEKSDLIIFSDAPKSSEDFHAVEKVREYLSEIDGFKSIRIIERKQNIGLAASIIDGVTTLCEQYGQVIVLEDDLLVSPYFLQYMNDGLTRYENSEKVISIHGYTYPVKGKLPETFFLKSADCWGWATWKRGWAHFEPDAQSLLDAIHEKGLSDAFDFKGQTHYTQMLERQTQGKIDSWAIRWYASAFLKGLYTLYPGRSLVQCLGNDGTGAHCESTSVFQVDLHYTPMPVHSIPVEENLEAYQAFSDFFKSIRPTIGQRVWRKCRSLWQ